MKLAVFQIDEDQYLGLDHKGALTSSRRLPAPFTLESYQGEIVLKTHRSLYVSVGEDAAAVAAAPEPGAALVVAHIDAETVTLRDGTGRTVVLAEDGRSFKLVETSAEQCGTLFKLTPPETVLEKLAEAFGQAATCCGQPEKDTLWNDPQHRHVLDQAVLLLEILDPTSVFLDLWTRPVFQQKVHKGLEDADYESAYINPTQTSVGVIPINVPTYSSHFWNPSTKKGLVAAHPLLQLLNPRDGHKTALTSAEENYLKSRKFYDDWKLRAQEKDLEQAAYYLGISLHYFTDLTQPMHAANFANLLGGEDETGETVATDEPACPEGINWAVWPDDTRHSGFEESADKLLRPAGAGHPLVRNSEFNANRGSIDWKTIGLPENIRPVTVGILLNNVALGSHDIWTAVVRKIAYAKAERRGLLWWFCNKWSDTHTEAAFKRAFPRGQRLTGYYLWLWARNTPFTLLRGSYAALLGRGPDETEIAADTAEMERGTTPQEIVARIAMGAEYAARHLTGPVSEQLEKLFAHILGRPAKDSEEVASWESFVRENGWRCAVEKARIIAAEGLLSDAAAINIEQNTTAVAYLPHTGCPAIFYRDNDTGRPAFISWEQDNKRWFITKQPFLGAQRVDGCISAYFDPDKKGISAFYRGENGMLQHATWVGRWLVQELPYYVDGAISAIHDPYASWPGVFFRGEQGTLRFIGRNGNEFSHEVVDLGPRRVGGAIAAVYDSQAERGMRTGYPSAFFVSEEGEVMHCYANQTWRLLQMSNTGGENPKRIAGAGLLSAVVDPRISAPAVFWTSYGYEERQQQKFKVLVRTDPQLHLTRRAGYLNNVVVSHDATLRGRFASRSLAAVAAPSVRGVPPHIGVFTHGKEGKPEFAYLRSTNHTQEWNSGAIADEIVAGGIAATLDSQSASQPHGTVCWRDQAGRVKLMRVARGSGRWTLEDLGR